MNAGFDRHLSERVWEDYALGMRSEEDRALLEEHLLICPACQDLLAEVDDYIQVVKAAAALLAGTGRRWSKPVAAATNHDQAFTPA
jgi:uncharacterized C2H2 Zn-finger protein